MLGQRTVEEDHHCWRYHKFCGKQVSLFRHPKEHLEQSGTSSVLTRDIYLGGRNALQIIHMGKESEGQVQKKSPREREGVLALWSLYRICKGAAKDSG